MIFAYCRVSTKNQNMERQIRNALDAYPGAKVIKEVYSGRYAHRPEWVKLLRTIKPGDTIVFDSISRMSRDANDGFELYEKLYNDGVDLVFLNEPHINTTAHRERLKNRIATYTERNGDAAEKLIQAVIEALNQYTMDIAREQIMLAFEQAQKEVDDLRKRTVEGIETARRAGKPIGRQPGDTPEHRTQRPIMDIIKAKSRDFDGTDNDAEVMALIRGTSYTDERTGTTRRYTIARGTYYKYKALLRAENE